MNIFTGSPRAQKFQARLLGLVYEDLLVPCLEAVGFEVLAGKREHIDSKKVSRPVVVWNDVRHVFDYVLARDGRHLISESKCWPLYEAGSATADPKYLERQKELRAFLSFDICEARCLVGGRGVSIDGKLLLWWQVLPEEAAYWYRKGIEVLSIQTLLTQGRNLPSFQAWLAGYKQWCEVLFDGLVDRQRSRKATEHGLDAKSKIEMKAQTDMKAEDVAELVQFLERNDIRVWLDGGWGVDALLEEQTRPHKDLDLVAALSDVPRMRALLAERGFALVEGGPPMSLVLADEKGLHIDVHPVSWDEQGNGIYRMQNGQDCVYPASGFAGSGLVLGQRVRCLTAETQMFLCHTGYELSEKDFREMDALHQRFGVKYPPEYQKQSTDDQT